MKRVLVVEDDPAVSAAIRLMLARAGYDTMIAPDAGAGMRAFESFHFDLAIVDIFMPGISGLATIAEFRQLAPALPILAISGFRYRDSMDPGLDFLGMAAQAGAAAFLQKPFAPHELIAAVGASFESSLRAAVPQETDNHERDRPDDA